jgi:uncharacterized protein YlxW (UPF0749 family)
MPLKFLNTAKAYIVSFILAGILIGILVAAHFQSSVEASTHLADELKAESNLLNGFDEDRRVLQAKIANLRIQIEESRKKLNLEGGETFLLELLDKLKTEVGLTRISGEGIEIVIADGAENASDADAAVVHAADLRDLINLLRTGNATAISVNNQRIILSSTINAVGNNIMINEVSSAQPFKIKAIGDTESMLARLNDENSFPDLYKRIKEKKINFEVNKMGELVISTYDGDYLIKYAKKSKNN